NIRVGKGRSGGERNDFAVRLAPGQGAARGYRRGNRVADFELGAGGFGSAAPIQNRLQQRHEFGGKRQLAVRRVPTGEERKQVALADSDLRQGRRAIVEFRQDPSRKSRRNRPAAMFPEMDVREVAVAWIGERGEDGVIEIDLTEQSEIAGRFFDVELRPAGEGGERRSRL